MKNRDKACRENLRENGFWNQKKFGTSFLILPEWGCL